MDGVLVEVFVARPAAVDVLPGSFIVERELVGRDSDDGAVLVMARLDPEWNAATKKGEYIGELVRVS